MDKTQGTKLIWSAIPNIHVDPLIIPLTLIVALGNFSVRDTMSRAGVTKVLLREPEVAREPVFMIRGRFSECKGEECKDGAVFFE